MLDLIEEIGQHRRIADAATRYLNSPYLLRFLINSYVGFATKTALGPNRLAGNPLDLLPGLEVGAVHQKMQEAQSRLVRAGDRQGFLPRAQHALILGLLVEFDQS